MPRSSFRYVSVFGAVKRHPALRLILCSFRIWALQCKEFSLKLLWSAWMDVSVSLFSAQTDSMALVRLFSVVDLFHISKESPFQII